MAPQGISEPIASVSTAHGRASESERFERIEEARRRHRRAQSRRRQHRPAQPRADASPDSDDRTVGLHLDVMA